MIQLRKALSILSSLFIVSSFALEIELQCTGDVSLYRNKKDTEAYVKAKGETPISSRQSFLVCGVFGC